MLYYKLSFVDKRIDTPEQIIARDIPKFCDLSSEIVFDLVKVRNKELHRVVNSVKAICDGSYFTYRLAQLTSPGWSSVGWIYVLFATFVLRPISPPFGKLHSIKLRLEGLYRNCLSNMQTHSEVS